MADEQRKPAETKRVMDDVLRRMLATPPDPHVSTKQTVERQRKKVEGLSEKAKAVRAKSEALREKARKK